MNAKRPTAGLTRRSFLGLAGGAAAGAAVAACAPRSSGRGPHGSERAQLVYQDWQTPWFPAMAQEMLQVFNSAHPNINVFYSPDPDRVDEVMIGDFQAGTAPDVMAGCCDFFIEWAQKGYLLDLRPFVAADLDRSTVNDWDQAQYEALFTRDGLQYALPKYHGALALYYNKDVFDRQRVEHPDGTWTHDDYLGALRRLTVDTDGDKQTDYWGSMVDISWERIQIHVNGWGGHFVDPANPARSLMAAPESLAAMRWLRERMWDDRLMPSPLDVQNRRLADVFTSGGLAMVEEGSWALKDILERARFRVGVAPFPAGPARRVTLGTTDGFGIYAGTRYPEAAWELLKFLTSPAYGRAMARAHLLQPARLSLVEEWSDIVRDQYADRARDLDVAAFAAGQVGGYSVTAEVFPNMAAARREVREAWQRIFVLGQSPVELMRDVSERVEKAQLDQP